MEVRFHELPTRGPLSRARSEGNSEKLKEKIRTHLKNSGLTSNNHIEGAVYDRAPIYLKIADSARYRKSPATSLRTSIHSF
jgi:hypothetical protein